MAEIDFILQPIAGRCHADFLRDLLSENDVQRFVASVAFVREDGVQVIAQELKAIAEVTTFFVGIRNDVTSIQSILALLRTGVKIFAVDTAQRSRLFHPKVFLAQYKTHAAAIIGSANLTFNGLHNNIEAGTILFLDLNNKRDKVFVRHAITAFEKLRQAHPDHVFRIADAKTAKRLFDEGRLVDERAIVAPSVTSSVRRGPRDQLKPIQLSWRSPPAHRRRKRKMAPRAKPSKGVTPTGYTPEPEFVLIWQSRGLKERDLNVPSGSNTAKTGSMFWKKGAAEDIDQRHFFRDEVFAGLDWRADENQKKQHLERTEADFTIVIKGLNYGKSRLKLSHNTNTESKAYAQGNSMTQVHWKPVKEIIEQRDLLGRILSLYRKDSDPPEFLIEID